MLIDLFPRAHARFLKLPLLGDHLDGLAQWLTTQGFPPSRIRRRVCKAPVLEGMLASLGIRDLGELSRERLLSLAPRPARNQRALSALVRSMAAFLADSDLVRVVGPGPGEILVRSYPEFLRQVRGLAASTYVGSLQFGILVTPPLPTSCRRVWTWSRSGAGWATPTSRRPASMPKWTWNQNAKPYERPNRFCHEAGFRRLANQRRHPQLVGKPVSLRGYHPVMWSCCRSSPE